MANSDEVSSNLLDSDWFRLFCIDCSSSNFTLKIVQYRNYTDLNRGISMIGKNQNRTLFLPNRNPYIRSACHELHDQNQKENYQHRAPMSAWFEISRHCWAADHSPWWFFKMWSNMALFEVIFLLNILWVAVHRILGKWVERWLSWHIFWRLAFKHKFIVQTIWVIVDPCNEVNPTID